MDFKEAKEFVMPFGKYKGRTIDDVASDDEGLRYLDWISGVDLFMGISVSIQSNFINAVTTYLFDPAIKKELDNL